MLFITILRSFRLFIFATISESLIKQIQLEHLLIRTVVLHVYQHLSAYPTPEYLYLTVQPSAGRPTYHTLAPSPFNFLSVNYNTYFRLIMYQLFQILSLYSYHVSAMLLCAICSFHVILTLLSTIIVHTSLQETHNP